MYYRFIQLFILSHCLFHFIESMQTFNITNANKLLCYSCKGSHCETILHEDENAIVCDKHAPLCWAGFIDQQPYRTCASRFCTPRGISLDSDIRIETCCHSTLCNAAPLSAAIWSKWYKKSTTHRPDTSTAEPIEVTSRRITPRRSSTTATRFYIVNEIVNNQRRPSTYRDRSEEQDDSVLSSLRFNASNPDSFGINWERVPYHKGFSNPVVSISNLLVLLMPVLLVFLF